MRFSIRSLLILTAIIAMSLGGVLAYQAFRTALFCREVEAEVDYHIWQSEELYSTNPGQSLSTLKALRSSVEQCAGLPSAFRVRIKKKIEDAIEEAEYFERVKDELELASMRRS